MINIHNKLWNVTQVHNYSYLFQEYLGLAVGKLKKVCYRCIFVLTMELKYYLIEIKSK